MSWLIDRNRMMLFEADGGGSGTGNGTGDQNKDQNAGEKTPTEEPVVFKSKKDLQAHIDGIVKERLDREREKAEKNAEETRKKAEADAAAKNGEWQKLAEQREAELSEKAKALEELTSLKERAERYEKTMKAQLEAARKGLPDPITALLDKMDTMDQLEWLAENKSKLNVKGPPDTPSGSGNGGGTEEEKNALKEFQQRTRRLF